MEEEILADGGGKRPADWKKKKVTVGTWTKHERAPNAWNHGGCRWKVRAWYDVPSK